MQKYRNLLTNSALLIVVTVTCLIILELVVRLISPSIFHPNLALIPNQDMNIYVNISGVSPIMHYSTNKWGFRGDEIPPDLADYNFILAIGGSTTESIVLDDKKTWPYLLQESLKNSSNEKITVQNAGLAGHTTRGHLLMMKEVVSKVKPDTIIFLVGVNDLILSLTDGPYLFDNSTTSDYQLFAKIRTYQIVSSWKKAMSGEVSWGMSPHHNIVLVNKTEPEIEYSDNYEKELRFFNEFERNLLEIIKIGKENDIEMIFLTQPLLYEDTEYWSNIEGRTTWETSQTYHISARTYARMLNKFNSKILEICEEEDVNCFDLAARIPHSQEYFYDEIHFNEKGSQLVAKEIHNYITNI